MRAAIGMAAGLVVLSAGVVAPGAEASRAAKKAEAKAIKAGFLKGRAGTATIRQVRISTADKRFAAVTYSADITPPSRPATATAATVMPAPVPAVVKKTGKTWKSVPSAPAKVIKDLKIKARSALTVSGDVTATFTSGASCTVSSGFYSAQLYDADRDISVRVEIPTWEGFKLYPAMAVRSIAVVSVGNQATTPQWETGQPGDAFSPSGQIYVDRDRWGLVEADLSHVIDGSGTTGTVSLSGSWACK